MNRRGFLLGAGGILASAVAPAIVRADSLMRVVPVDMVLLCARPESFVQKGMADPLGQFTVIVREYMPYGRPASPGLFEGALMPYEGLVVTMTIEEFTQKYPGQKVLRPGDLMRKADAFRTEGGGIAYAGTRRG